MIYTNHPVSWLCQQPAKLISKEVGSGHSWFASDKVSLPAALDAPVRHEKNSVMVHQSGISDDFEIATQRCCC